MTRVEDENKDSRPLFFIRDDLKGTGGLYDGENIIILPGGMAYGNGMTTKPIEAVRAQVRSWTKDPASAKAPVENGRYKFPKVCLK